MKIKRLSFALALCLGTTVPALVQAQTRPVYQDVPFVQDYSIKYYDNNSAGALLSVAADRNKNFKVVSKSGLLHPSGGEFLYPGKLVTDNTYRFQKDKKTSAVISYQNQLVYLSDQYVYSNAWAGKVLIPHGLPGAKLIAGGADFVFLVSDGTALHLVKGAEVLWKGKSTAIKDLKYSSVSNTFYVLTAGSLQKLPVSTKSLSEVISGIEFTSFDIDASGKGAVVGTGNGFLKVDLTTGKGIGALQTRMPVTDITTVKYTGGRYWFGTSNGAFSLRPDGKYDYYNGQRWIPSNQVVQISEGPDNSVLILTDKGIGQICFRKMTLYDKSVMLDKQVRQRHIRVGFNSALSGMSNGDISTGFLSDSDNDGLWTTMYLGGEIFRYAVTKSKDALQNCRESLDAMERLYDINPVPGFPARSFERAGHISELSDHERWQHSPQKDWDWKSTTSSDEVIGHIFAFGAMAELMADQPDLKKRAVTLIDTLMNHVISNDMYLIDYDGKPTQWGRWHPEYVNSFPINVGDRKLNSSNITAMLQTAYHFTKKEKYKKKIFELFEKHGYFENLMRPMKIIGSAPAGSDELASLLSDGWNHSDDEMYYMGYWGLYRYALNDTLKKAYKKSIIDHWEAERPEREGLWNISTAITGTPNFDLNESIWYLKEHPLDFINWNIENSHRKDIDKLEVNFRKQSIKEVLPPDERPIQRHNGNMFNLDRGRQPDGTSEESAGDIWLLPYWMGRYLGVISAPKN